MIPRHELHRSFWTDEKRCRLREPAVETRVRRARTDTLSFATHTALIMKTRRRRPQRHRHVNCHCSARSVLVDFARMPRRLRERCHQPIHRRWRLAFSPSRVHYRRVIICIPRRRSCMSGRNGSKCQHTRGNPKLNAGRSSWPITISSPARHRLRLLSSDRHRSFMHKNLHQ